MNDAVHTADIAHIRNAGLVLLDPFLPALFKRLDLLSSGDDGKVQLRGDNAARAVQLLHYLAVGSSDAPAPELLLNKLLNKLLCGLEPDFPAPPVELRPEEREMGDQLLAAVTGHWSVIRNASIEGLRTNFLQLEGHLQSADGEYTLAVARSPFDVLLSSLPWSLNVIRQPWMRQALRVRW